MREQWMRGSFLVASGVTLVLWLGPSVVDVQSQRGAGPGGGRGGGQAARPMPPVPRLSDGSPNLSWADPANKGVWRTTQHRNFANELIERHMRSSRFAKAGS